MTINPSHSNCVFGLDIFRAIAIIYVVLGYGGCFLNNTFLSAFPYIHMVDGVEWFFVLSDFLISNILLKTINQTPEKRDWANLFYFWKRRWFRTLPNYYLILLVNYYIVKHNIIHEDISQFSWRF
jgi:peptidoglycan/LPS O-acetylase OafA/YrhL